MQTLNEVSCILDDMQDTLDEMSHVSDMISIMTDPNSTEQEKQMAESTLAELCHVDLDKCDEDGRLWLDADQMTAPIHNNTYFWE